jgi:hypothetical protein
MRQAGDATSTREMTDLSPVYVTLSGEETVMTSAHFGEGIRDELGFWEVICVREDVGESRRIGSEQSMATKESAIGKGVAELFYPCANDVVVLLLS